MLVSLAIMAPAAALTPEQQAVTDCIRKMPADELIARGTGSCLPPDPLPINVLFPLQHHMSAARAVVRYRLALLRCPAAKPGPAADKLWKILWNSYRVTPPDREKVRAWIDREFERDREKPPIGSVEYRCEQAKGDYGEHGRKIRDAIVMRDGSTTIRKCVLDGSCGAANTIDVWLY